MRLPRTALLGLLVLASAGAPGDGARTPPALTFTGKPFPPPGLPEDLALLGELLSAQRDVLDERAVGLRTVQHLADGRLDARLAEAARAGPDGDRSALEGLLARLRAAWERDRELLSRPWPVDPRLGCRERGIAFEVLMGSATNAGAPPRLVAAREEARRCLERQRLPLVRLREANRELRATVAEARAALGDTPAPASPSLAPAAAPPAPPGSGAAPATAAAAPAPAAPAR